MPRPPSAAAATRAGARCSDEPNRQQTFAAYLHRPSSHEIADLRLGKKTDELHAQSEKPHKQIDGCASC